MKKRATDLTPDKEDFLNECLEWALMQPVSAPVEEWIGWAADRLGIELD
jgi:hypothetical protein